MDELSELTQQLQKEVAELERALRLRETEEAAKLRLKEARLRTAEARLARANALLKTDAAALDIVENKRAHLLARIDGWPGQLWRAGYGSVPALAVMSLLTAAPLAGVWLGNGWAGGILAGNLLVGGLLYFLIPAKR